MRKNFLKIISIVLVGISFGFFARSVSAAAFPTKSGPGGYVEITRTKGCPCSFAGGRQVFGYFVRSDVPLGMTIPFYFSHKAKKWTEGPLTVGNPVLFLWKFHWEKPQHGVCLKFTWTGCKVRWTLGTVTYRGAGLPAESLGSLAGVAGGGLGGGLTGGLGSALGGIGGALNTGGFDVGNSFKQFSGLSSDVLKTEFGGALQDQLKTTLTGQQGLPVGDVDKILNDSLKQALDQVAQNLPVDSTSLILTNAIQGDFSQALKDQLENKLGFPISGDLANTLGGIINGPLKGLGIGGVFDKFGLSFGTVVQGLATGDFGTVLKDTLKKKLEEKLNGAIQDVQGTINKALNDTLDKVAQKIPLGSSAALIEGAIKGDFPDVLKQTLGNKLGVPISGDLQSTIDSVLRSVTGSVDLTNVYDLFGADFGDLVQNVVSDKFGSDLQTQLQGALKDKITTTLGGLVSDPQKLGDDLGVILEDSLSEAVDQATKSVSANVTADELTGVINDKLSTILKTDLGNKLNLPIGGDVKSVIDDVLKPTAGSLP